MSQRETENVMGVVIEALPNTFFKVKINQTGEVILTYLSGKMRLHRIRIIVGDKVTLETDPYGGKSRIVKRL